jgi:ketosteroid isomerase-like protein
LFENTEDGGPMNTDSETSLTRALVERFVHAWTANDIPSVMELLASDARWDPPRSIGATLVGPEAIAQQLSGGAAGRYVRVDTVHRTIRRIIVDGSQAVVLVQLSATAHSGAEYVNEYAWHYEIADGRVRHIVEYADTLFAARLGFLPFEATE